MLAPRQLHLLGTLVATVLLSLLLTVAATVPALATEGGENEKVPLPENPHDQVGLIILAFTGLAVAFAGYNAYRQFRGERPQADGKIRWR